MFSNVYFMISKDDDFVSVYSGSKLSSLIANGKVRLFV